jgi:hypothetical protein
MLIIVDVIGGLWWIMEKMAGKRDVLQFCGEEEGTSLVGIILERVCRN